MPPTLLPELKQCSRIFKDIGFIFAPVVCFSFSVNNEPPAVAVATSNIYRKKRNAFTAEKMSFIAKLINFKHRAVLLLPWLSKNVFL